MVDSIFRAARVEPTSLLDVEVNKVIPSSRILCLLFLDPLVVIVTSESVTIDGKVLFFDSPIQAACIVGKSYICVVTLDSKLSFVDKNAQKICEKPVGIPGEWEFDKPLVISNPKGTMVGVSLSGNEIALYSIVQIEDLTSRDSPGVTGGSSIKLVYMTKVHLKDVSAAQILNLRNVNNGTVATSYEVLWSYRDSARSLVRVDEVSRGNSAMISLLPLNTNADTIVPLEDADGSTLLIARKTIYLVTMKDLLSGNIDLAKLTMPMITAVSSTRLANGTIQCFVLAQSCIYQISVTDRYLDSHLICSDITVVDPASIDTFLVIPNLTPKFWVVIWVSKIGKRGRFLVDGKDQDRKIYEMPLDQALGLSYDANDFVFDEPSHRLLGFGSPGTLTLTQKAMPTYSMIPGGIPASGVNRLIYVAAKKIIFFVRPWRTQTYFVDFKAKSGNTKFSEVDFLGINDQEVLAAGIVSGSMIVVTTKKLIFANKFGLGAPQAVKELPSIMASIAFGCCAIVNTDNKIAIVDADNIDSQFRTIEPHGLVTFVRVEKGPTLVVGTTAPSIEVYSLGSNAQVVSIPIKKSPRDVFVVGDLYYIGFKDGTYSIYNDTDSSMITRKIGHAPVTFVDTGYSDLVVAKSVGLWILSHGRPTPLVTQKGGIHSLAHTPVMAACEFPSGHELELMVAFNKHIFLIRPQYSRILSLPYTMSFHLESARNSVVSAALIVPNFRLWVIVTGRGLEFIDLKHRTILTQESELSRSETIYGIALWNFELEGRNYLHLAVSTESKSQSLLRTLTFERTKDVVTLQKRLKWELDETATHLLTVGRKIIFAQNNKLGQLSIDSSEGRAKLSCTPHSVSFQGAIQDMSAVENVVYVSTAAGFHAFNLDSNQLISTQADTANNRRHCTNHLVIDLKGRRIALVAETRTYLTVLYLDGSKWITIGRVDRHERIKRMRIIKDNLVQNSVLALLSDGSYAQIHLDDQPAIDYGEPPFLY